MPGPAFGNFPTALHNPFGHAELHSISIRVSVFDIKLLGFAAATAGLRVIARTGQDREAGILRKARVDLAQGAEQKYRAFTGLDSLRVTAVRAQT